MDHQKPELGSKLLFMHLLSMLTLYVSAVAFLTVIYQVVNLALPDPLISHGYRNAANFRSLLRQGMSFFVVMFPTYLWTLRFLQKKYTQEAHVAKAWARKFLVYMTMFIAGVTILFSLVFLVNRLLDGELTINFLLKLLGILFVTSSVFGYYTYENKQFA